MRYIQRKTILCGGLVVVFLIGIMGQFIKISLMPPSQTHKLLIIPQSSETHAPILINGSSQFNSTNGVSAGDGSYGNPYIIENWVINSSSGNGFDIENTNDFVIMRNCTIDGVGIYGTGFYLKNVTNIIISNNSVLHNKYGIYINSSNNNTIENNTFFLISDYGIFLTQLSNNNTLTNNTVLNSYYCGFGIILSSNNIFTNNTLSYNIYGIYLDRSNNSILINNNVLKNKDGIRLFRANNCNLTNNTILENDYGIILETAHNNTLTSNTASANKEDGIVLLWANNNTLINNTASANKKIGINLKLANENIIWGNNLGNNIFCQASSNDSINNHWYYKNVGNFYSDYMAQNPTAINDGRVWNIPYIINGNALDLDINPLVNPFGVIYLPLAPILQAPPLSTTGNNTLTWTTISGAISYKLYRSISVITSVSGLTPIATSIMSTTYTDMNLVNGTYYYVVIAMNSAGDSPNSNCVNVTVAISPLSNDKSTSKNPGIAGFPLMILLFTSVLMVNIIIKKKKSQINYY